MHVHVDVTEATTGYMRFQSNLRVWYGQLLECRNICNTQAACVAEERQTVWD